MSQMTMWERVKTGGKSGFDKTWKALDKLGAPVNRLSNKLGSEAFWPTTLDKESDKAARILKSFCKDGFYAEEEYQPQDGPKMKQRVIQKIPEKVIQKAKGLAIFTTMRTGLWISGAGGSGVLVARKADGTWSPPSGILLHTAGLGFLVGVDIYDCVVVINTDEAMGAFTKVRCTLGSEISVAAGPVGAGGVLETEIHKRQAPIYTYMKSRGFYAGVQIDGSIIIERFDENERFYGQKLSVQDILAGKVRHPPYEVRKLLETIKAAQGDRDVDETMLPTEAPPGDFEIEDGSTFGVPDKDDPDPYGVLALEKEGMSLKEAGTMKRASWEEFSFKPSPSSPVHEIMARQSEERARSSQRNSWRASAFASEPKTPSSLRNSIDQPGPTLMADSSTQTDLDTSQTISSPVLRSMNSTPTHRIQMQEVPENAVLEPSPPLHEPRTNVASVNGYSTPPHTPPLPSSAATQTYHRDVQDEHDDSDDDDDDDEIFEEAPTVHAIQTIQPTSPKVINTSSKARIVDVPKRLPPKLPPRNPNRSQSVTADLPMAPAESLVDPTPFADPVRKDEDLTETIAGAEAVNRPDISNHTSETPEEVEKKEHDLSDKLEDVNLAGHDESEAEIPLHSHESTPQRPAVGLGWS